MQNAAGRERGGSEGRTREGGVKGEGGGDRGRRETGRGRGERGRERETAPLHTPHPTPPLSAGFSGVKGGRRFKRSLLYNVAGWGGGEIPKSMGTIKHYFKPPSSLPSTTLFTHKSSRLMLYMPISQDCFQQTTTLSCPIQLTQGTRVGKMPPKPQPSFTWSTLHPADLVFQATSHSPLLSYSLF